MKEPSVSDSLTGPSSLLEPSSVLDSGPSCVETAQNGEQAPKKTVLELLGLEDLDEQGTPGTQAFESEENAATRDAHLAIRAVLSEVNEELNALQRKWDLHLEEERRLENGEGLTDSDLPKLRAKLFLTERARKLAEERERELRLTRDNALAGQRRAEAQVREQRGQLQELQRRLRHRELELQELRGESLNDQSISCIYLDDDVEEDLAQVSIDSSAIDAIPSQYMTKAEALSALESLQEQLDDEHARIAELERARIVEQNCLRRAGEERDRRREKVFATQAEALRKSRAQSLGASGAALRRP